MPCKWLLRGIPRAPALQVSGVGRLDLEGSSTAPLRPFSAPTLRLASAPLASKCRPDFSGSRGLNANLPLRVCCQVNNSEVNVGPKSGTL